MQMLKTFRFYVIFFSQATHYGGCLLLMNLVDPIAKSQGVNVGAVLVLVISLSSAVGRVSIGWLQKKFKTLSTTAFMGLANLFVACTNILLSLYIDSAVFFYILVSCTGFLYGTMTVLSATR